MRHGVIRLAVCQLECHPALVLGDRDYLGEPFVDESLTLSILSRNGVDTTELREANARAYRDWHGNRIANVLECLSRLEHVPDVTVFPECSIPLELLPRMRAFALRHGVMVIAGTHTRRLNAAARKVYADLGLSGDVDGVVDGDLSGVPVFAGDRAYFRYKRAPSIFETTNISPLPAGSILIDAVALRGENEELNVVPIICSEALQSHQLVPPYDLIAVLAYNRDVDAFQAFIQHHTSNRIPVIVCNDGCYGGSGVHLAHDRRIAEWWWAEPHAGRLPRGDGILVVDIHSRHSAPQVSIANPMPGARLVCIQALVYESAGDAGYGAAKLLSAASRTDAEAQLRVLDNIDSRQLAPIQRLKVEYLRRLARLGNAGDNWWGCLGNDCQVASQPDLQGLQNLLARTSSTRLMQNLASVVSDSGEEGLSLLGTIMQKCSGLKAKALPQPAPPPGGDDLPNATDLTSLAPPGSARTTPDSGLVRELYVVPVSRDASHVQVSGDLTELCRLFGIESTRFETVPDPPLPGGCGEGFSLGQVPRESEAQTSADELTTAGEQDGMSEN